MKKGDLVRNTKEFDTKTTKVGIIVEENINYYAVKWIYIPNHKDEYCVEKHYGLSLTQHFYKNKKNSLYRIKNGLGHN
jgi:hypothetical protein